MIRQLSSAGPCKYLHNYYKKTVKSFCKTRKEINKKALLLTKKKPNIQQTTI